MASDDPLFSPTVQDQRTHVPPKGSRPWRSSALYLVGFFGGSLAATMFALSNQRRLDDAEPGLRSRTLTSGIAFTLVQVAGVMVAMSLTDYENRDTRRVIRVVSRALGMGCGWWLSRTLAGAERRYLMRTGADEDAAFDGAFLPGLWASVVWGLVAAVPVAVTYALFVHQ